MKHTSETWPPPPTRPEPVIDVDDDDWLTANDVILDVTWRDYAVVIFAALWLLLACSAVVSPYRLPTGTIRNIHHIIRAAAP